MKNVIQRSWTRICLLGFFLVALCAMPAFAQASPTSHDVSWYNSTDTTFTLTTREQLYGLADIVNGVVPGVSENFKGKTIALGADIVFNYSFDSESAQIWGPIGDGNAFEGTFDGKGHTLANLLINPDERPERHSAFFDTVGVNATVKNIIFSHSKLVTEIGSQNKQVATVFCVNKGTITGVRVKDATALGTSNISGFGILNEGMVKHCRVINFSVEAFSIVSGLIDSNQMNATVDSCGIENMSVNGNGNQFLDNFNAGLVFNNSGLIQNSYANRLSFNYSGDMSNVDSALVHQNDGSLMNCYSQATASTNVVLNAISKGDGYVRNVYCTVPDEGRGIGKIVVGVMGQPLAPDGIHTLEREMNGNVIADQNDRGWTTDRSSFTVPRYIETIDLQNGEKPTDHIVLYNIPYTVYLPSRTGYVFNGWYRDSAYTQAWNNGYDIFLDDTTLYAKWSLKSIAASLTPATLNFDMYHPEDATATLDHGTQTFAGLKSGDTTLTLNSDYTLNDKVLTIKSDFMKTLGLGDHTIAVRYSTCSDLSVAIKVGDSAPKRSVTEKRTTGGTVEASTISAQRGEKITLTSKPDEGYEFISFAVDGERISGSSFSMPDKDVEVSAVFKPMTFTVAVKESTGGTVGASSTLVEYGDTVALTAKPQAGYELVAFIVDGERISANSFTMPAKNVEVSAVYKLKTFTIAAPVTSTRAGRVVGARTITYGGTLKLTAQARSGYYFVRWTKNGKLAGKSKTLIVKNVTSQVSYKAEFAKYSVFFKLKRINGHRITVRWNAVKGASSYQIISKRAVGSSYRVRWTGKNATRLYTSIDKRTGQSYLYKMRYSKIVKGKRVWSAWTPAVAIK